MPTILVVDDDPDLVELTTLYLTKEGFNVVSATNREEGLAAIATHAPDLVVLDVMMSEPDDGIAMAQDLRRQNFDKPILLMSCIEKVTGMKMGRDNELVPVDDFLPKPAEPAVLVSKVKQLLAKEEAA